jgi:glycine/sarcosine N-methyltransferase
VPQTVPLYDCFTDYDRFVHWERRLANELPFIEAQLTACGARRVLDVACGTGQHTIALAQRGYQVTGVDLSTGMIQRARENAASEGLDVRYLVAGFGDLRARLEGHYDALLCLGNSLPHVLTAPALRATLVDFASVLRPGGLLLIQNRNFDAVMAQRARWMSPQSRRQGGREWIFLRFYDFEPEGTLAFNVVTLARQDGEAWAQRVEATRLYPWRYDELVAGVSTAGFEDLHCYGDMSGASFDRESSGNLVFTARTRYP